MARWRAVRGIGLLLLAWAFLPGIVRAQTPSPMQEWQYSSGIILERLFEPNLPDWRVVAGLGAEFKPLYDGAKDYRTQGGPVLNVRYKDIVFASVGEGFGYNFIRGDNYRAGIALSYDLGRRVSDDYTHLHGLPDIGRAPVVKMFGSYVISKDFPMIFRWGRSTAHHQRRRLGGRRGGVHASAGQFPDLDHVRRPLDDLREPSLSAEELRHHAR